MNNPTLSTPNLSLHQLRAAETRQVRWLNTREIMKYSENRWQPHTLESQEAYIKNFPGFLWGIFNVADDEHIGNISARVDKNNNVADVAILIGEIDYWGKGFGKEAWDAACTWLLDKNGGGLRKIEAGYMANNFAMQHILVGSNFIYEGERLNHFLFNGMPVGMKLFGRFR